jgi:hypothetical protein
MEETMAEPKPAAGPPSRSGVRRFGDRYQDLIAWSAAMRVIQRGSPFDQLGIEVNGTGNVDDVVLRSRQGRHHYIQVKWTTHPAEVVDNKYLTSMPKNGKSVLQKFYASWKLLLRRDDQPPIMELVTNRNLDRTDPLLRLIDGRSDLLNPAARDASPASAAGQRINEWALHLACDRDDVLAMLDSLLFKTGLTVSGEEDRAQTLMLANGLLSDADALARGIDAITKWVLEGRRVVSGDDITKEVERMRLYADDPRAVLLVQAIDRDPHPEDATIALDWVDLYEGDSPPLRRRPRDPGDWATMSHDIDRAVTSIAAQGFTDIVVRGAMRQATFFTIGARLAQVTGTTISYVQHGTPWPSNAPRIAVPAPEASITAVGAGHELAVAVGMTVDPTSAVTRFINTVNLPVQMLLTLMPAEGAHDQSVAGPGEAVAYAQALRNAVREQLESTPADRIHLFLAGPGGLALLLGHRWNRLAPTVVYEDLGPGRGYVTAFTVAA